MLAADACVVAWDSYSAPLRRTVGVDLPIYPGKGYSTIFELLKPEAAPSVSLIDDQVKCAISRTGNQLRVVGTIEVGGYDLTPTTPLAQARCVLLARWVEDMLPGVADTRLESEGVHPASGPACGPPRPLTFLILAKRLWEVFGSTRAMACWAGPTAQARARH